MKCPVCRRDMKQETDGNHNFWWRCPNCGKEVGRVEPKEEKEEETDQP